MDKILKLAVAVALVLAGSGVFYHFVIYVPELERARIAMEAQERASRQAQAEQEKRDRELQESARQANYSNCVAGAEKDYLANWSGACKSQGEQQAAGYRRCMATTLGETFCRANYPAAAQDANCSLPTSAAEGVNRYFREAKEKCLAEAKAGLG